MDKRFITLDVNMAKSCPAHYLTDDYLRGVILENNTEFAIYRDARLMGSVVVCENKPRDTLVYGIEWEEIE